MNTAIQTKNLTKYFTRGFKWQERAPVKAVDSVTLRIKQGELFGLVGPNQAGKTTLIKLLCTLVLPSRGDAVVNGYDIASQKERVKMSIGLVSGEERSFYWRLTGRQNLQFFAALYGLSDHVSERKIRDLLDVLEMTKEADTKYQEYSSGIKQRMHIARSLLNSPRILFMDEATKSLDPPSASKLRTFIRDELVGNRNTTVLMTTHHMAEAEAICDRIAIMQSGKIRAVGTLDQLRNDTGKRNAGLDDIFKHVSEEGSILREEGADAFA